jgi:hypothetical protein
MKKTILSLMSLALAFGLAGVVGATVTPVTPSTNDINRTNGWAHVDQISKGVGTTNLQFISIRPFYSCFEYRTDGDTSQIMTENGGVNYNTNITDGLYPYFCQNNNSTHTITANGYVEVRMVFGAETDERFDWTRFDVVPSPVLSAEDFGVVNYDTGLGILKGYTAGFGLTNATLAGATSVVVQLFAGNTLLQTNTAILPKFNADITGTQFSSPFDVSGTFNYVTDGYWTNVRETQYGQSIPATKVVATVTLASGQVVTATNTLFVGDPSTIFPPPPSNKDQCKDNGWKTFTNPTFKNQGQCVSFVQANLKADKADKIN